MIGDTARLSRRLWTLRCILGLLFLGELLALAVLVVAWPAAVLECHDVATAYFSMPRGPDSSPSAVRCMYRREPYHEVFPIEFPIYPATLAGLVLVACLVLTVLALRRSFSLKGM